MWTTWSLYLSHSVAQKRARSQCSSFFTLCLKKIAWPCWVALLISGVFFSSTLLPYNRREIFSWCRGPNVERIKEANGEPMRNHAFPFLNDLHRNPSRACAHPWRRTHAFISCAMNRKSRDGRLALFCSVAFHPRDVRRCGQKAVSPKNTRCATRAHFPNLLRSGFSNSSGKESSCIKLVPHRIESRWRAPKWNRECCV